MQRDEPFQIVGKFRAVLRLAFRESVARQVVGVAQVIDAGYERTEPFAIVRSRPIRRTLLALPLAR